MPIKDERDFINCDYSIIVTISSIRDRVTDVSDTATSNVETASMMLHAGASHRPEQNGNYRYIAFY